MNKKYKICVVSCSNFTDEKNKSMVEISSSINKKYCNINGYDYVYEQIEDDCSHSYGLFMKYKYKVLKKYIKKYDFIVFIDADAAFVNPNKKIEDLIDNEHEFYSYQHSHLIGNTIWPIQIGKILESLSQQNKTLYFKNTLELDELFKKHFDFSFIKRLAIISLNPFALNGGFMIFKNTNLMEKLIDLTSNMSDFFLDKTEDEACIGLILQHSNYKNCYKIYTPEDYVCGHSDLDKNTPFYYNEERNYVIHNGGSSVENKIKSFELIKNNKWWKSYFEKIN